MTLHRRFALSFVLILVLVGVAAGLHAWNSARVAQRLDDFETSVRDEERVRDLRLEIERLHKELESLPSLLKGDDERETARQENRFAARVQASLDRIETLAQGVTGHGLQPELGRWSQAWASYPERARDDLAAATDSLRASTLSPYRKMAHETLPALSRRASLRRGASWTGAQPDNADLWLFLLLGGLALICVLLAVSGLSTFRSRFRTLLHGAAAIGGGDLHHVIKLRGKDEFTDLGRVFNNMSHDLQLTQRQLTMSNQELEKRNKEIDEQRKVSESLLRNILPAEIADELSAKGEVTPKLFDDVSILFTDFVGFTPSTESLGAQELVRYLNGYFTDFDKIARRYRLEKLKTIGDSYMCAGGLPAPRASHAVDTVLAALEMVHVVRDRATRADQPGWAVRLGIHSGPVVAGVVGIDKFAFDIWGKTVNFSSRVETTGAPDRINISTETYERVKDLFDCEARGKVRTKEQREFDMYFVRGVHPHLLDEKVAGVPSGFLQAYQRAYNAQPPAFPSFL